MTERRNTEIDDAPGTDDEIFDPPTRELVHPEPSPDISPLPSSPDLLRRINDAEGISGDVDVVVVTDDDFVTSGDVAGEDVEDVGLSSDASLGGLGTNIDDLPGDETPISREHRRPPSEPL